jgi:hypothetical protein
MTVHDYPDIIAGNTNECALYVSEEAEGVHWSGSKILAGLPHLVNCDYNDFYSVNNHNYQ